MRDVAEALRRNGIDASTLHVLRQTDLGDVLALHAGDGGEAIRLWRRLREAAGATGHWPVICATDRLDLSGAEGSARAALMAAAGIDAAAWFAERAALRRAEWEDEEDPDWPESPPDGEWPSDAGPNDDFGTPYENGPWSRVPVALVPTTRPWEAPAYLGIGGWNECPDPSEHCAVLRHWHERYGAELAVVTDDVLELGVAAPPVTRDAAMALAREQYEYCPDIVDQGTETYAGLAATLLRGGVWFFWWD